MPTMTKSKTFQPDRKNASRYATSLRAISTTKTARHAMSSATISGPQRDMSVGEVSIPRRMALKRITPRIVFRTTGRSRNS
jgi:hypothetical protein